MQFSRVTHPVKESPSIDNTDAFQRFVLWALDSLDLHVQENGENVFRLALPDRFRREFNDADTIRFSFAPASSNCQAVQEDSPFAVTLKSQFFGWIRDRLGEAESIAHAVPREQADRVHDITPVLYAAYQVDGGRVQLAGCTLEDEPFLRVTQVITSQDGDKLVHFFVDRKCNLVDKAFAHSLNLEDVVVPKRRQREWDDISRKEFVEEARKVAVTKISEKSGDLVVETLVWCKRAQGKLVFSIGQGSVELPFSGWAQRLASGVESPPPYTCKLSGLQSYHLTATDDGRITVVEAIEECSESDTRVLATDLQTCEATKRRALAEHFETCPVSGQTLLRSALVKCSMCQQDVSPKAIVRGRCGACRSVKSISKDEPRLARVLDEFPGLDRWRTWRMSETSTVYVLVANALIKRLLVVVDRDSLEVQRVAEGSRFTGNWVDVPGALREEILR